MHDRLEAAVFADGEIDLGDEAGAARHFPFPATATSVLQRVVEPGECWDLSVRGAKFGLDDFDDLLVLVNVGELILEAGASVVVQGNLLVLVVQRLVCEDVVARARTASRSASCRPRSRWTHAAIESGPPTEAPASTALRVANGVRVETVPSFLGPRLVRPRVAGEPTAEPGAAGTAGADGAAGASGGPSKLADITIGRARRHAHPAGRRRCGTRRRRWGRRWPRRRRRAGRGRCARRGHVGRGGPRW